MKKYRCILCGYIYDPEIGDPTAELSRHRLEDLGRLAVPRLLCKNDFEPVER